MALFSFHRQIRRTKAASGGGGGHHGGGGGGGHGHAHFTGGWGGHVAFGGGGGGRRRASSRRAPSRRAARRSRAVGHATNTVAQSIIARHIGFTHGVPHLRKSSSPKKLDKAIQTGAKRISRVSGAPSVRDAEARLRRVQRRTLTRKTARRQQSTLFHAIRRANARPAYRAPFGGRTYRQAPQLPLSRNDRRRIARINRQGRVVGPKQLGRIFNRNIRRVERKTPGPTYAITQKKGQPARIPAHGLRGVGRQWGRLRIKPTLGQKIVKGLTGVSPTSRKPGTVAQAAVGAATIAVPELLAGRAVRAGRVAETLAEQAPRESRVVRAARAVSRPGRAARAGRTARAVPRAARLRAVRAARLARSPRLAGRAAERAAARGIVGRKGLQARSAQGALPLPHYLTAAVKARTATNIAYGTVTANPVKAGKRTLEAVPGYAGLYLGGAAAVGAVPVKLAEGKSVSSATGPARGFAQSLARQTAEFVRDYSGSPEQARKATEQKWGYIPAASGLLAARPGTGPVYRGARKVVRDAVEQRMGRPSRPRLPGEKAPSVTSQLLYRTGKGTAGRGIGEVIAGKPIRTKIARIRARHTTYQARLEVDATHPLLNALRSVPHDQGGFKRVKGTARRQDLAGLVGFLAEERIPKSRAKAEVKLTEIFNRNPEGSEAHLAQHLLQNPHLLTRKGAPELWRAVTAWHGTRETLRQAGVPSSRRAELLAQAQEHGIPPPEEIIPRDIHHLTDALTVTEMRREVTTDRASADALRKDRIKAQQQAKTLRAQVAEMERADKQKGIEFSPRTRRHQAQLLNLEANIRGWRASEVALRRQAKAKHVALGGKVPTTAAERAAALEEGQTFKGEALSPHEQRQAIQAYKFNKAHGPLEGSERMQRFEAEMAKLQQREGLGAPTYVPHREDVAGSIGTTRPPSAVGGLRAGGAKLYQREIDEASLQARGVTRYDLQTLFHEGIQGPIRAHVRQNFANDVNSTFSLEYAVPGEAIAKRAFRDSEMDQLAAQGRFTPDVVQVNLSRLGRFGDKTSDAYFKLMSETATRKGTSTGWEAVRDAGRKGDLYAVWPREAAKEFFADLSTDHTVLRALSLVGRATSRVILGSSLSWMVAQPFAEGLTLFMSQKRLLNPRNFVRALQAVRQLHRDPEARRRMEAWTGGTAGTTGTLSRYSEEPLRPGNAFDDTFQWWNKSWFGEQIHRATTLEYPNMFDRWKGSWIRQLGMTSEADKQFNGFLKGIHGSYLEIEKASKDLKGKSLADQMTWTLRNPKAAERLADYVDNALGNWSALTRYERAASPFLIFYPFMRFSLNFIFKTFPRQHPVTAALSTFMAGMNANQLRELFPGGRPAFLTDWAMVPYYGNGPDKQPTSFIPLSRALPGSNALTDVIGQGDVTAGVRALNPWIGAAITAGAGRNTFGDLYLPPGAHFTSSGKIVDAQGHVTSGVSFATAARLFGQNVAGFAQPTRAISSVRGLATGEFPWSNQKLSPLAIATGGDPKQRFIRGSVFPFLPIPRAQKQAQIAAAHAFERIQAQPDLIEVGRLKKQARHALYRKKKGIPLTPRQQAAFDRYRTALQGQARSRAGKRSLHRISRQFGFRDPYWKSLKSQIGTARGDQRAAAKARRNMQLGYPLSPKTRATEAAKLRRKFRQLPFAALALTQAGKPTKAALKRRQGRRFAKAESRAIASGANFLGGSIVKTFRHKPEPSLRQIARRAVRGDSKALTAASAYQAFAVRKDRKRIAPLLHQEARRLARQGSSQKPPKRPSGGGKVTWTDTVKALRASGLGHDKARKAATTMNHSQRVAFVGGQRDPSLDNIGRPRKNKPLPGLDAEQQKVASQILSVGKKMGATHKELVAAMETGLVESGLRNLSSGDGTSVGWRQEISTYGSAANRMNVKAAAQRFFSETKQAGRGKGQTAGQLAQAVQRSAFPGRYDPQHPQASEIVRAFAGGAGVKVARSQITRMQAIRRAAKGIQKMHLPYTWGGGHAGRGVPKSGLDCSGAVSQVLIAAKALKSPMTSGGFMSYGKPGPGAVTIYANSTHVFMKIGNRYFGTSHIPGQGGGGFVPKGSSPSGQPSSAYTVRHVPGLGRKVAAALGIALDTGGGGGGAVTAPGGGGGGVTLSSNGTKATVHGGTKVGGQPTFSNSPILPDQQLLDQATLLRNVSGVTIPGLTRSISGSTTAEGTDLDLAQQIINASLAPAKIRKRTLTR